MDALLAIVVWIGMVGGALLLTYTVVRAAVRDGIRDADRARAAAAWRASQQSTSE